MGRGSCPRGWRSPDGDHREGDLQPELDLGLDPGHSTSLLQRRQAVLQAPDQAGSRRAEAMRLLRGLRDTTPVGPTVLSTACCQLPSTVHQLPRTYISETPPTPHPSVHCPDSFSVPRLGMRPGTPPHPSLVCCVKGRVGLGFKSSISG